MTQKEPGLSALEGLLPPGTTVQGVHLQLFQVDPLTLAERNTLVAALEACTIRGKDAAAVAALLSKVRNAAPCSLTDVQRAVTEQMERESSLKVS